MKAVRVDDTGMHIREIDTPKAGDEQALVRITASGVCHSDLHLARRDWGRVTSEALGHEAIGIVEALGPRADRHVSIGDRVILGLGGAGGAYWCGACEYCIGGSPRLCAQAQMAMGTFAEHYAIWGKALVKIPDTIADHEAPLACGGLTAYAALKKLTAHGIGPGRTVAIVGAAGGLGHYAVQIAAAFGYRVVAIDVGADRLAFAKSLGAEHAVDATEGAKAIREHLGGVDAAVVFAARLGGFDLGLQILRKKGLFVGVGLPPASDGAMQITPFFLMNFDPTIVFSAVGTVQEMRELIALAGAGKVKTHVSRTGKLSELPAIFDELQAGKYVGRAVITDMSA